MYVTRRNKDSAPPERGDELGPLVVSYDYEWHHWELNLYKIIAYITLCTKFLLSLSGHAINLSLQACSGLKADIESAIHAMRKVFEYYDTEAILLVDAENAFNNLN